MKLRWALSTWLAGLVVWVTPAAATFHEISIREVYPGSAAQPELEYVELQMWSAGQNFVKGHTVISYKAGGTVADTSTFTADVPAGGNQSTILLGTPAVESLGVKPDAAMAAGQLDPAGGAVCWDAIDCVSWGSFSGSLPSPAGSPATPGGISDGMALRRTIAPGCATLLESSDDRDNSAVDFSVVFPEPRPNSLAPTERACASSGDPSGYPGQGGRGAPQTKLKRKPPHKTFDRTPTFRFTADETGSTFQCKLDRKPFRSCRSPFTSRKLSLGPHTFKVRARDESGKLDQSPASYAFRIVAKR